MLSARSARASRTPTMCWAWAAPDRARAATRAVKTAGRGRMTARRLGTVVKGCLGLGILTVRGRTRTTKEQYIAVSVLKLESTQAIIGVTEWLEKPDTARRELCRQRVGIRNVKVGVPAGDALLDVAGVVGHRIDTDVLEH